MNWRNTLRSLGGKNRRTNLSPTTTETNEDDPNPTPNVIQSTLQIAKAQWKALMTPRAPAEEAPNEVADVELSDANQLENIPWGDVRMAKGDNITRIYSVNLNGLQLDAAGGKFDSVCRAIKIAQADIFCGQEHNVDTTKSSVRNILFDTAKQH